MARTKTYGIDTKPEAADEIFGQDQFGKNQNYTVLGLKYKLDDLSNKITNYYQDITTANYYYGGLYGDGKWIITKYDAISLVKTKATVLNNVSKETLSHAWANRETLSYT